MRNLLLLLYLIINVFLYILNMELFNSVVDVDFGFAIVSFMPLILLQVVGLLFVLSFYFLDKNREITNLNTVQKLTDQKTILEKDIEINNLKFANQINTLNVEAPIEATIVESTEEIA